MRILIRGLAGRVLLLIGGLFGVLLLLEAVLSTLPVQDGPNAELRSDDPAVWFEPDRRFTWSKGWRMERVNELRTNNLGWVSSVDYDPDAIGPLLVVIGDSYVEALMIAEEETLTAQLRRTLAPSWRVYSLAASGAALSQYLAFAELAQQRFRAEALVIVIVGNDFDESLRSVKWQPGFHHFSLGEHGGLVLERRPLADAGMRTSLRRSALVNYLFRNLEIRAVPRRLRALRGEDAGYRGNTRADADPARVEASRLVIRRFLDELPPRAGLDRRRIVLLVDALRQAIYAPDRAAEAEASYFGIMRRELIRAARAVGHPVVDLQPLFRAHYQRHERRFEFPNDGHWNSMAHELAAVAARGALPLGSVNRWPIEASLP